MLIDADESQLVLVDFQARLQAAMHEAEAVWANARRLAQAAQALRLPVWGTEQNPSKLGPLAPELSQACERVLAKMQFSAVEEGLAEWLQPPPAAPRGNARSLPRHLQKPSAEAPKRSAIVIAGVEAHVCLLQTALGLLRAGLGVWVVGNACGSRRAGDHAAAMARLSQAGATIVTHEMVAFEWLHHCEHPRFRDVLGLIKGVS